MGRVGGMSTLMSELYVHSTKEKCYVEHPHYGVIARLCKVSAEYYQAVIKEDNFAELVSVETNFQPTFIDFQKKCRVLYNLDIANELCPEVFRVGYTAETKTIDERKRDADFDTARSCSCCDEYDSDLDYCQELDFTFACNEFSGNRVCKYWR
jgi:hypothetical protein